VPRRKANREAGKHFFFEKKKQKTFDDFGFGSPGETAAEFASRPAARVGTLVEVALRHAAPPGQPVILPVRSGACPAAYAAAAASAGFTGEPATACDVLGADRRIVLAGLGDAPGLAEAEAAGAAGMAALLRARCVAIDASALPPDQAASMALGAALRAWYPPSRRTQTDDDAPLVEHLDLVAGDGAADAWSRNAAVLAGVTFARDLVAEPANTLTPLRFVERLQRLVEAGIVLDVLHADALRAQNFGALLAVGGGAANPPCLAVLRWRGPAGAIAFVGKGVTFDTGGISIKPADQMWDMRADMAGAAACAGAMLAMALRGADASAVAILPLAENAVGAASYRPSDILRMHDGSTVEVVDTDAEGRLILADALSYARTLQPRAIVDLATLTGSIVTALGHHKAGLFANNDAWAARVAAAGASVGENLWRMPVDASHRRAIDSPIADLRQCSPERFQPDACQAAAFLREFAGETPWAHLDIAGVESKEAADERHAKGATGFGVRLLNALMEDSKDLLF
jgi:leucyl aminopeptidase